MLKKLLLLPLLLVPIVLLHAVIPSPQNITFQWPYPAAVDPSLVFNIYKAPTLTTPKPWTLFATAPGSVRSLTVPVTPGEAFYYIAASNFWGEADPSNVIGTPPVALSVTNGFSVTKGP